MSTSLRRNLVRGLLLLLVCLVGLPALGLFGSWAYLEAESAGLFTRWRSLGTPPGDATQIAGADLNRVYVGLADGSLLGCDHRGDEPDPVCWSPVPALPIFDQDLLNDEPFFEAQTPAPGPVRDSLTATMLYADAAYETRDLLLEDGRVMKAELGVGAYLNLGILCLGPVLGLGLGILVAIAAALAWGLRARRQP